MTDFTIKNLAEDVDDAAPKFDMAPAVEAHFARADLGAAHMGISFQRLAPDARMPFGHKHAKQEEIYVVVEGSGRIKLDDEVQELRRWDAVRIGADTVRAVEAGADGITFLVVGAPFEGANDAEMLPNWWD